jgi:hypothetical protein
MNGNAEPISEKNHPDAAEPETQMECATVFESEIIMQIIQKRSLQSSNEVPDG